MATTWLERHATAVAAGLGFALLAAFVLIGALFVRLEQTRSDLERVEGGALLATVQLQTFRDELTSLGPQITDDLDVAIDGLATFEDSTLEFDVQIDETVAIDAEILIDQEFTVPIDTTIPISETIETTISIQTPLGDVPVDVTVPVNLDVPVVLDLTFAVEEAVPISTDVPVQFDLPIEVAIADTGLADLGTSLASGLASFRDLFANLEE